MPATPSDAFVRSLALDGQRVLITGAAAGIGWAAAQVFAAAGARVMLADIDAERAAARVRELGPTHSACGVDMADSSQVERLIETVVDRFGGLDVLVNNAGLTTTGGVGVAEQSPEECARIMAVNLGGTLAASERASAIMRAQRHGAVINLASGASFKPVPFRGAYSASKAAIAAMTARHAAAWAGDGIRVNAVAPGYTRTELVEGLIRSGRVDPAAAALRIPLGRMAEPAEMAAIIAFLASPRATGMHGCVVLADGGSLLGIGATALRQPLASSASEPRRPNCIVFGIDSAIGTGVAQLFAERGARLLLAGNAPMAADRLAASLGPDHHAIAARPAAVDFHDAVSRAVHTFGNIDGIVVVADEPGRSFEALMQALRTLGPSQITPDIGALLAIVPDLDAKPSADAAHAADIAAATMQTRTLAAEWCTNGIRANVLCCDIDANGNGSGSASRSREIGEIAHFLVSREAGYITGSVVAMNRCAHRS